MESIKLFKRSGQEGVIRLRFRLQDTERCKDEKHPNGVDLYHKSQIKADAGLFLWPETLKSESAKVRDAAKLKLDGEFKDGIKNTSKTQELKDLSEQIKKEIEAMRIVYAEIKEKDLVVDGKEFEAMIDRQLHPERVDRRQDNTLLGKFRKFYSSDYSGLVLRDYQVVDGELFRWLSIIGRLDMVPSEFTVDDLLAFHAFLRDEYKYASQDKYAHLYAEMLERNIPKQERSQNTVASKIKKLRTFFNTISAEDINFRSPFSCLTKARRETLLKEEYDVPVCLCKDDFLKVMATEVPSSLQETKDIFLLHCNFGMRVEDFERLTMEDVKVSDEGIPYIRYVALKTMNKSKDIIGTPILRYSLDIIKKYNFDFHCLKYLTGKSGYNKKIKELMRFCGIDTPCDVFDKKSKKVVSVPLYELASSKLARKTITNLMKEVQIDEYTTGLHKSKAVERYRKMTLVDRFKLMNVAYAQPNYKVDKSLNVMDEVAETPTLEYLQRQTIILQKKMESVTQQMQQQPQTAEDFAQWSNAAQEMTVLNQQLQELNTSIMNILINKE